MTEPRGAGAWDVAGLGAAGRKGAWRSSFSAVQLRAGSGGCRSRRGVNLMTGRQM